MLFSEMRKPKGVPLVVFILTGVQTKPNCLITAGKVVKPSSDPEELILPQK